MSLHSTLPAYLGKVALVATIWNLLSVICAILSGYGAVVTDQASLVAGYNNPTGSMAETLLGFHKQVICPQCGYEFAVNCSQESNPAFGKPDWISGCTCPNCRQRVRFIAPDASSGLSDEGNAGMVQDPGPRGGDHIVVGRGLFGAGLIPPRRFDLMVFRYPVDPSELHPALPLKYVKRLMGLPGETLAIHHGDLYVLPPGKGPKYDDLNGETDPVKRGKVWQKQYMHVDDPEAPKQFGRGGFEILRKSPNDVLTMKRIVYDNDHPAKDLPASRWAGRDKDAAWKADDAHGFRLTSADDKVHWLAYRHLLRDQKFEDDARRQAMKKFMEALETKLTEKLGRTPSPDELRDDLSREWYEDNLPAELRKEMQEKLAKGYANGRPELITDFMGYNTQEGQRLGRQLPGEDWVGDLILECEVRADQSKGELTLELSKGVDRFRARFDLATGDCKLLRVNAAAKEEELAYGPTGLKGGSHHVLFANVDERLTLWVDQALPFGDGVAYKPPETKGPTKENDLEPASAGIRGTTATVRGLKLWRDTYYTSAVDGNPPSSDVGYGVNFGDPATWDELRKLPVKTFYVQPDCYFVLGDNSAESADSRTWGLVPRRLLLGKAFLVYYPLDRARWFP